MEHFRIHTTKRGKATFRLSAHRKKVINTTRRSYQIAGNCEDGAQLNIDGPDANGQELVRVTWNGTMFAGRGQPRPEVVRDPSRCTVTINMARNNLLVATVELVDTVQGPNLPRNESDCLNQTEKGPKLVFDSHFRER